MIKTSKRGKGKIGTVLGLKDAFKAFNKTQDKESIYKVDYKTYKAICADFNKKIVKGILEDAETFYLPYKLGEIRIKKKKMNFKDKKKLKIDWKQSHELGYLVYHLNDHSDNYSYRWFWRKQFVIIKNKAAYSFTATRSNTRALADILLNKKGIDYYE